MIRVVAGVVVCITTTNFMQSDDPVQITTKSFVPANFHVYGQERVIFFGRVVDQLAKLVSAVHGWRKLLYDSFDFRLASLKEENKICL